MDKKLQQYAPSAPVVQTGDRSLYVNSQPGAQLTINVTAQAPVMIDMTADKLLAVQRFSREYYQLIVTGEEIFSNKSLVINADRALSKGTVSDAVFDRFSMLPEDACEELTKIPAIICNENTGYHGNTSPDQMAIYAWITKVKKGVDGIKIYFEPLDFIPQHILSEYSIDFGIHSGCALTDLNISRWTIKEVNLFEACIDAGVSIAMPK